MSEESSRQSIIDEEHLKLLSLGYMISAGVCAFFSLFGLLYAFMGVVLFHIPASATQTAQPPPAFVGWIVAGFGLAFFLVGMGFGALLLRTAFCIKHRKSRTFCMVIAGISCLGIPYGTVLGVLSFMVLTRDSVARQFDTGPASAPVA